MDSRLTPRWTKCRLDPRQYAYLHSNAVMNVVPAGRRSFKTEASKRRVVARAIAFSKYPNGRFFACAPTQQQAKDIFWSDLKALVPRWALRTGRPDIDISESELTIRLWQGAIIKVAGLDKPARIEGGDWDGGVIDEYADCRPDVLDEHIMPMLVRGGWIDIIGVPGGRNHYYRLTQQVLNGELEGARHFHWKASEVLHLYLGRDRAEAFLAQMRKKMDPLTFDQEFNASFVVFEGRVYYGFLQETHARERLACDPKLPLILCFDFNVAPGVCAICQEQRYAGSNPNVANEVTACIDEVWISNNSNTKRVCQEIAERYAGHPQEIWCYGDATGGARGTAKVEGSDWELIEKSLRPVFGSRLYLAYAKTNPRERVRVNAMNSRIKAADGKVRFLVDPVKCPHVVTDFDGVVWNDKTGEIDKTSDKTLTHLSDAIGYYVAQVHPLAEPGFVISQF